MERNAKIAVHYLSGTVERFRAFPSKDREEVQTIVNLLKDIEGTTRKIKFVTYSDGQKRYRVTPEPSKGEQ